MTPEPEFSSEERELFARGIQQFNDGYYFECHDTLEDLWQGIRGPSRDFFQGLIQVSVAFYHLGNENPAGAQSMLKRALSRLDRYEEGYLGMNLAAHRLELRELLRRLEAGEVDASGEARPVWAPPSGTPTIGDV